jgi:hypothetical protein
MDGGGTPGVRGGVGAFDGGNGSEEDGSASRDAFLVEKGWWWVKKVENRNLQRVRTRREICKWQITMAKCYLPIT